VLNFHHMKIKNFGLQVLPHLTAVIFFLVLSYAYFSPLLEGKEIMQSDNIHWKGMSKEIRDFRDKTGEEPLWTNSMFGGMPAYFISTYFPGNQIDTIDKIIKIGQRPATFVFLSLLGFYIMLLLLGVNAWLSIIGAIAYAFSSYFFIIIAAGHNTKAFALAYMPAIIGSIIYAYRHKLFLGLVLTGLFLALQIHANHPQIVYYTAIIVVTYVIVEFIESIKKQRAVTFFKISALLIIPVLLAIGSNMGRLWTTYEYTDHSMRGKSELEINQENQTSGLDKDYATRWSYGIDETLTLLIPNYAGGSSGGELSTDSETYQTLVNNNVSPSRARQFIKQVPLYHGDQPFTEGPVYVGAIVLFFFVFGLFIIKGPLKWWIVAVTILSVMLAWGNNFMWLTNLFMEYFPAYNKFRTVSMTLVMAEFTIPLMAVLALRKVIRGEIEKQQFMKALKNSLYIVGGICLLLLLMPGIFQNFTGPSDTQLPGWLAEPLREDRKAILRQDAFRSLLFILIGAGIVLAFFFKKLKKEYALLLLGIFVITDMWAVNKRYLNEDNFTNPQEVENPFPKSRADQIILEDPEENFRVLNLAVNTFNDASTSFYHHSIGGYHGAKLQRYQDMIDYHIQEEMQNIITTLQGEGVNRQQLEAVLNKQDVLNMLNTKYIVYNKQQAPIQNNHRFGSAWFVDNIRLVETAKKEINALDQIDPYQTAVIHQDFKSKIKGREFRKDTNGTITLTQYEPNHLKYEYRADNEQLIMFSEVYYPDGWKLYVDGEPSELFRANYILRAAVIPEGAHQLEMKFNPRSYILGNQISLYSSILLISFLLLMLGHKVFIYYKG